MPVILDYFNLPIRVYYEDTDAGGIVYHSIYLNYMERARTEWLLARNINPQHYAESELKMFVVRNITISYHKPAHLCDDLIIKTAIKESTKTRVYFDQKIYRDNVLLVEATVEVVCLDVTTRKPLPLPSFFKKQEHRSTCNQN